MQEANGLKNSSWPRKCQAVMRKGKQLLTEPVLDAHGVLSFYPLLVRAEIINGAQTENTWLYQKQFGSFLNAC